MAKKRYGIKLDVDQFASGGIKISHLKTGPVRLLVEQLRYAGVVSNHEGESEFTIWAPAVANCLAWQENNMKRMRSFGLRPEPITKEVL